MPTIKGYSVSNTAEGGNNIKTDAQGVVYSFSGNPAGNWHCGRRGAYDGTDTASMKEGGRVPTLYGGLGATPRQNHDVTALGNATASGPNRADLVSTEVTVTTSTITGSGSGLIVTFTTTAAGAVPAMGTAGNRTIVDPGDGYATGDIVEFDGWPGSRYAVTAA